MDERYSSTIHDRLTKRLQAHPDGCLIWTGALDDHGYGRISRGAQGNGYARTHRVAWELAHEADIPDGMIICHRCDNPPCCNPDHLFVGTHEDNSQDMMSKDRGRGQIPVGQAHPNARLSDAQVAELRILAPVIGNYASLGRLLGISKQHARSLALGAKRCA